MRTGESLELLIERALVGQVVSQLSLDHATSIQTVDGTELRIETPFQISTADPAQLVEVNPDHLSDTSSAVVRLLHQEIVDATIDETGALSLHLAQGARLACPPDPTFEAWTLVTATGDLVVCMPGGDVAHWANGAPKSGEVTPVDNQSLQRLAPLPPSSFLHVCHWRRRGLPGPFGLGTTACSYVRSCHDRVHVRTGGSPSMLGGAVPVEVQSQTTGVPGGMSREGASSTLADSSGVSAHRSIASDTSPRIRAGSRLSSTTTLRPVSSSTV